MMTRASILPAKVIEVLLFTISLGQIMVAVNTDKTIYQYG